jgi:hypothetical protein
LIDELALFDALLHLVVYGAKSQEASCDKEVDQLNGSSFFKINHLVCIEFENNLLKDQFHLETLDQIFSYPLKD